jgi:hypothetical protein
MIRSMMRLVRGTPVVRMVLSVLAALFTVWGAVALAGYPLLRLDAAAYEHAIGDASARCAGDPVPARGGCWSAVPARVTVSGVDGSSGTPIAFAVVDMPHSAAMRADLLDASHLGALPTGTRLTVRFWHDRLSMLVVPAATGAAPLLLATRDSPTYHATALPVGDALTLLLGVAGLLVWGRPALDDVRTWRERRRPQREGGDADVTALGRRGLARYGIDLPGTGGDDVQLTGQRTAPQESGAGWNVRPT